MPGSDPEASSPEVSPPPPPPIVDECNFYHEFVMSDEEQQKDPDVDHVTAAIYTKSSDDSLDNDTNYIVDDDDDDEYPSPPSAPRTLTSSPMTPRRTHRQQIDELSHFFEQATAVTSKKKKEKVPAALVLSSSHTSPRPTLLKYIKRNWGGGGGGSSSATGKASAAEHQASFEPYTLEDPSLALMDDESVDSSSSDSDQQGRPWQPPIDWSDMPTLPHFFSTSDTLTLPKTSSITPFSHQDACRCAWEQGHLLQAVLLLLAERDQVGVEGSVHSDSNIWKQGPLKKKLQKKWKVKYVELRHGNFCVYEDSHFSGRQVYHLRQNDTVVRKMPEDFVFELSVQGSPTTTWMASSEEERQSWIRGIHASMIGGEMPRREVDLVPHLETLMMFTNVRDKVGRAQTKKEYMEAVQVATMMQDDDETFQVPVEWIREQTRKEDEDEETELSNSRRNISLPTKKTSSTHPARTQLHHSIADMWAKMGETTFAINGYTVPSHTSLSSERILGGLTRCILEFDRAASTAHHEESGGKLPTEAATMTELQAVLYARNIIMSVLKSKEQQDASCAVHHLLNNSNLVIVSQSAEDRDFIVNMDVSLAGEELPDDMPITDEYSGWLLVRRPKQSVKSSKRRYAVLSGSVLSYYEKDLPRPNGLRGQVVLNGATIQEEQIEPGGDGDETPELSIKAKKKDHDVILSFEEEADYIDWKDAIQEAIEVSAHMQESISAIQDEMLQESLNTLSTLQEDEVPQTPTRSKKSIIGRSAQRVQKLADGSIKGGIRVIKGTAGGSIRGSMRVVKGAKDKGGKLIKSAKDGGSKVLRGAAGRVNRLRSTKISSRSVPGSPGLAQRHRRPSLTMLLNNTPLADKREPTVQCVVQATQVFTVEPRHVGDAPDQQEPWLSVHITLYQAFLLRGGPCGRMGQGDALIEIEILKVGEEHEDNEEDDSESTFGLLPDALWS
jgi:hypothetical protein